MKTQKIIRLVTLNLGLLMLVALAGASEAFAVKLPNQTIPANGSTAISVPFTVSDRGKITVKVNLRVNTFLSLPLNGESKYRAELVRMLSGLPVVASADATVGSAFETVTLTYDMSNDCSKIGSYAVRLSNIAETNRQEGLAEFPEFFPPVMPPSSSGTLPQFGVTQGNPVPIDIPNSLEPTGSAGTLNVTATWEGTCPDLSLSCKLRFQLVKVNSNGGEDNFGSSSTGYAQNSLGSPKMELKVGFTSSAQTDGNFRLKVTGAANGNVQNVKATVRYTPKCGG